MAIYDSHGNLVNEIRYKASHTLKKLHSDNNFVRAVMGPIGSGKSVGCCEELLLRAFAQQPNSVGMRLSRWVIVRNTYRELIDTTMETFHEWIPRELGVWEAGNMKFNLVTQLPDGTTLNTSFLFRALDKPKDVKKLLSLEITGGFVNEAREVPLQIIQMLQGRCGRYPRTIREDEDDPNSKILYGPTWHGIIMDTNPPDTDHWWYKLFEENKPLNHSIYYQPSGLSESAENISHLVPNYYTNMMAGKDPEWIKVYIHGQYGFVTDGKPVYPEYNDNLHSTSNPLPGNFHNTLYIGIDFGLTPAAVFGQKTSSGAFHIIDELCTFDMGAVNFGKLLKQKINTTYKDFHDIEVYGDPAGEQRAQTDEITPFMILHNIGINCIPTFTNDPLIRRESVVAYLSRLDFIGEPALVVGPNAPTVRKGFAGGYKYRRLQVGGEDKYIDKPDKNKYSHAADAVQYMFLGAFGSTDVIGGYSKKELDYSSMNRRVT